MLSIHSSRLRNSAAILALVFSGALAPAMAQQVAASATNITSTTSAGEVETLVVTGTAFDPETAPAKSSLDTMEPQTIISKSYIQDSVAATGTYTTILAIAPSMTGTDLNGPGLSDGGVKNTLRGLSDGNFGINFDGVPFGDTNGPTHHSQSYFPSNIIGNVVVDRGPGNAGNMGPSTYGGSVNLFSDVLTSESHASVQAMAGNWGTSLFNGNYQTGDLQLGGLTDRLMLNFQDTNSAGYLTHQTSSAQNYTIKNQLQIAPTWTVTFFATYNGLFQGLEDNSGATAAQLVAYGKNYANQITNPALGNYYFYNHVHKKTDLDYVRLQGDVTSTIHLDNTFYSLAYVNKTLSTTSVSQTAADIAAGITEGNCAASSAACVPAKAGAAAKFGTVVNGVNFPSDVPGYTKQNAYRNWGDILRLSGDYDFGWLKGQVRTGVWWEHSSSQRERSDFDATKCFASANCNPWHDNSFADSRLFTGQSTITSAPARGGYFEYIEHSGWDQYQPFVELDLKPIDDLTITPGFKYVWWNHYVAAPLEQKTKPVIPVFESFTTTRDLPFLMVNYKIQPSWSVYAQYAQGIYVPDISAFEQSGGTSVFPKAQTTTNYQVGTVYYADNWTFDGDLYYIGVNNNISFQSCTSPPFTGPVGETCALNTGVATYKGIEGEGTYAFTGDLEGLAVFLNGSLNSSKSGGKWLKQAPMWTSAGGIFYKRDIWKLSLIDKVVGQQYSDNTDTTFYKLGAYNVMDFKGSVDFQNYEISLGVFNLLNSRSLASVGITDKAPIGGTSVNDYTNRPNSLDQYYFQPSRSFQVSVTANF